MKIKVLTSYKPGTWNEYAKRAVDSVLQHWPQDTQVAVYHEAQSQDVFEHPRVEWLDAHKVQPDLLKFKNKYKDDPVANGEINEIPNGVRRPVPMAPKGSFCFCTVRELEKGVVIHAEDVRINLTDKGVDVVRVIAPTDRRSSIVRQQVYEAEAAGVQSCHLRGEICKLWELHRTRLLFEFSLCLSRACLGKCSGFVVSKYLSSTK